MKVDGALKSLIQGVSQQPPRTRLAGQCSLQENFSSNPVTGLTRRPAMEHIAELFSSDADPQFFELNLATDHPYLMAVVDGAIRVFDSFGNEKTVSLNEPDDGYLASGKLVVTTLGRDTYIANTTKITAMKSDLTSYLATNGIVYVLGGAYSHTYSVTVTWNDGSPTGALVSATFSYLTPDGSNIANELDVTTDAIATHLATNAAALTTNGFNTKFQVTRFADHLYIAWAGANAGRTDRFTIATSDGAGGQYLVGLTDSVSGVSRIPKYAPEGYFLKVTGDGRTSVDDWYVVFHAKPDGNGVIPTQGTGFGRDGVWDESALNGITYMLDGATLPHALEYNPADDTFTYGSVPWKTRQVGDTVTNANPSFVGNTINDVASFQSRLVFLSAQSVIMTRTNRPTDFFRESATALVDTDPIDVTSTIPGMKSMDSAVSHNRDFVIFSNVGQFLIQGRTAISPSTAALVLTTAFEASLDAHPVSAGANVIFANQYGNYLGFREFFVDSTTDNNDSRSITQHVLKYIRGRARHIASSSNFNLLLSCTGDNKLYAYEYIWEDQQKAQASWSTWILPHEIMRMYFEEGIIYLVYKMVPETGSPIYMLGRFDLDQPEDAGLSYHVYLDRKMYIENVNLTFVNPMTNLPALDQIIMVQGEGCPNPGLRVVWDSYDPGTNTFTLKKDMQGGTIIMGQRFKSRYKPTMPLPRDNDGIVIGTASLVLKWFRVNAQFTGNLEATITSPYREDQNMHFSGYTVSDTTSLVGRPGIRDSVYTIPFNERADRAELEIWTDSHLPLTMMDIEFQGQYGKLGTRITTG